MAPVDPSSALGKLATASGLQIGGTAPGGGCPAIAAPEEDIVRAVLEDLLDHPLNTDTDIADALVHELQQSAIEPVIVAWDGRFEPIAVGPALQGAILVTEVGNSLAADVSDGTVCFQAPLPMGVHTLSIGISGREHLTMVISTPRQVPSPTRRFWGVFASAFALRGADDHGVGNFTALRQLADSVHELGGEFVATLPLLPVFLDTPQEIVPFAPVTRVGWNMLNIDLALAPGAEAIADVVVDPPERTPRLVDYPDVAQRFRSSLIAYSRVVRDHPALRAQLDRFLVSNPRIMQYARFRSLGETMSRDWRRWPAPWRQGDLSSAPVDPDIELAHQVGQWLAFTQIESLIDTMRDRGQRLQLEITMGVHSMGFDVWSDQRLYMNRTRVFEPPDGTAAGSDWGHPAARPQRSRRRAHHSFHEAIRHHAQGGFIRIDQTSALWRTWCVPDGADPDQGVYVNQASEEQLALVCLEANRVGAFVTGGNLSSAPDFVRQRVKAAGVLDPLLDARTDMTRRNHNEQLSRAAGHAALIHLDELLADYGPRPLESDGDHRFRVRHPRGFNASLDDERVRRWVEDFARSWA
ncbi:MAG: 4-alpha-glucanotransferase [Acidimicrobiales bacterium]|nr:4-alpha-glucanotransferase [Acidimicrobiales bacterium]